MTGAVVSPNVTVACFVRQWGAAWAKRKKSSLVSLKYGLFINKRPREICSVSAKNTGDDSQEEAPVHPLLPLVSGKRFSCTGCGVCCTGSGEVWFNDNELLALAKFKDMDATEFANRYCKTGYKKRPGWHMLKTKAGSDHCVFLENGTHCSVYGARPLQCSTYPWWPELMDEQNWLEEAEFVCEGINHPDSTTAGIQAAESLFSFSSYISAFPKAKKQDQSNGLQDK
jgi:Fe-S-cluster containining protein